MVMITSKNYNNKIHNRGIIIYYSSHSNQRLWMNKNILKAFKDEIQ